MGSRRFEITETAGSVKGFYVVVLTGNRVRYPIVRGIPDNPVNIIFPRRSVLSKFRIIR